MHFLPLCFHSPPPPSKIKSRKPLKIHSVASICKTDSLVPFIDVYYFFFWGGGSGWWWCQKVRDFFPCLYKHFLLGVYLELLGMCKNRVFECWVFWWSWLLRCFQSNLFEVFVSFYTRERWRCSRDGGCVLLTRPTQCVCMLQGRGALSRQPCALQWVRYS